MIFSRFFLKKTGNRDMTKSVNVYISKQHNQVIVCPNYQNNAGIIYEQDGCELLNFTVDHSVLGNEVLRNIRLFALKDKNLRGHKLTDWPAFKCSKLKSVRSFEESFTAIRVSGNNESNIILCIEAPLSGHDDIFITSRISSAPANTEEIGELIMRIYNVATA